MSTGTSTLSKIDSAEVTNISKFGFWILSGNAEYFVSFQDYPDFLNATVKEINDFDVDMLGNFHWKNLDIDIEKEALLDPEKYKLVYMR